jgi:hypothetical protein
VGCQPGVPFPVPRCLLHLQEGKQAAWNIVNFVPRLRTERARDVATASPKCPFRDPNLTQIAPVLHRRRGKQAARDIVNFVPKRVPNAFQNASKAGFCTPVLVPRGSVFGEFGVGQNGLHLHQVVAHGGACADGVVRAQGRVNRAMLVERGVLAAHQTGAFAELMEER